MVVLKWDVDIIIFAQKFKSTIIKKISILSKEVKKYRRIQIKNKHVATIYIYIAICIEIYRRFNAIVSQLLFWPL